MVQPGTMERMRALADLGYQFVMGNNPAPKRSVYGCPIDQAVRVSQVNHRFHGKCIRTIWAVSRGYCYEDY
jgi:hypothetical protein